jgi:Domain of unknown function (DU1801)
MTELKTKPNSESVREFLDKISDEQRRSDCQVVLKLMKKATGAAPTMWGSSIVGFGKYRYRYESGREGEWPVVGFSPRKNDLTLYIIPGFERFDDLMNRLGKFKTGKSCLYIKKLSDVDPDVLNDLINQSVQAMSEKRIDT